MLSVEEGVTRTRSNSTCRYVILNDFRTKLDNNIQPNDDLPSSAALYMEFFWWHAVTILRVQCTEAECLVSYRVIMRLACWTENNT